MHRKPMLLCTSVVLTLLALFLAHATSASAAPRHAPITGGFTSCGQVGKHDNDLTASGTFTFGSKAYMALAGDVTQWIDSRGTHSVNRLFVVAMPSCQLVWTGPKIGPSNGWVRAIATRTSGNNAAVYFGGSFTSVNGQRRLHSAAIGIANTARGLKFSLSGWTVSTKGSVGKLAIDGSKVYLASSSLIAVNVQTAKIAWSIAGTYCGITALAVTGADVFAGGFERRVKGGWQYQLRKLSAKTGKPVKGFGLSPGFNVNQKYCGDASARGHETYSGTIPISLTTAPWYKIGLLGGGGMANRLIAFSMATGKVIWSHSIYGDGQVVSIANRDTLYGGWHLSAANTKNHGSTYGTIGGYFDIRSGALLGWNKKLALVTSGANRDGSNNGSRLFVHYAGVNCIGGGFSGERHGFACQRYA